MIEMTAAQIAEAVSGLLVPSQAAWVTVTGKVVVDSRLVEPGGLFVALPGAKVDGADFAAGAVREQGAALVLAARPIADEAGPVPTVVVADVQRALGDLARQALALVRERDQQLRVAAVTGSQGKTTTKDLLAQILSAEGPTVAPIGSFNNEVGLPLTVLRIDEDTAFAALEMGADHPGNIAYLTRIAPPEVGVVLTVGTAHLETFGSRQGIAEAKAEMVTGLRPGGTAVLNADDPLVIGMKRHLPVGADLVTFGQSAQAQVRAEQVRLDPLGRAGFHLVSARFGAHHPVQLKILGEHHVSNALAAAAAALVLGLAPGAVAQRLSAAALVSPHRMAVTERGDGITIIDDAYNANPESMAAGLQALVAMAGPRRRRVAVIGEMRELGPDAELRHEEVGRLARRLGVNLLVVVGVGARAAFDGAVLAGANTVVPSAADLSPDGPSPDRPSADGPSPDRPSAGGASAVETRFVPDLQTAEALVPQLLHPGDVVLVKASNGSKLWQLADQLCAERAPGHKTAWSANPAAEKVASRSANSAVEKVVAS